MYPYYEFGGRGALINLAVANGFPPAVYRQLMQPLTATHHVIAMLPRALWEDTPRPPQQLINWRDGLAQDLLQGLRHHTFNQVIAIGHSFGGIASLLAAIAEPQRFKALILLDPTIFATEIIEMLEMLHAHDAIDQMPLVTRAEKRQRHFSSTDEAFDYFRSKPLFTHWSDDALRLYAEHGTTPTKQGVSLAWSPEWEAYYFKTGYTQIWEALPKLRGIVPTLIIRGTQSDTYTTESAAKVRHILPDAQHVEIEGGHLFPQEKPQETAAIIQTWLASNGLISE